MCAVRATVMAGGPSGASAYHGSRACIGARPAQQHTRTFARVTRRLFFLPAWFRWHRTRGRPVAPAQSFLKWALQMTLLPARGMIGSAGGTSGGRRAARLVAGGWRGGASAASRVRSVAQAASRTPAVPLLPDLSLSPCGHGPGSWAILCAGGVGRVATLLSLSGHTRRPAEPTQPPATGAGLSRKRASLEPRRMGPCARRPCRGPPSTTGPG